MAGELKVDSVSKTYGPVQALSQVSTTFLPGRIHAVLGENGAGKSTLMGMIAGLVTPDSGLLTLDSTPLPVGIAVECRKRGIGMVHQHFTLVPEFTIEENLALSALARLTGTLNLPKLAGPALELASQIGWTFDKRGKVRNLPVGVQQRVEIIKAMATNEQILVLDEPTAVLGEDEIEDLFRILRNLAERGKTIILIAHKLREVRSIAQDFTVLRRGKLIQRGLMDEVTDEQLADWMVGDTVAFQSQTPSMARSVALKADAITVLGDRKEQAVRGLSLTVNFGEVVGIGGVDGNGQLELAEALAGVRPLLSGTLSTNDTTLAYIPQDRRRDGLALDLSLESNLMIGPHPPAEIRTGPLISSRKIRKRAQALVEKFSIKIGNLSDQASSLSGGNQQKIVVARELDRKPNLIVALNPTRGLDLKATAFVRNQLIEAAKEGAAVVLLSADADELAHVSHRIEILSGGQFT